MNAFMNDILNLTDEEKSIARKSREYDDWEKWAKKAKGMAKCIVFWRTGGGQARFVASNLEAIPHVVDGKITEFVGNGDD